MTIHALLIGINEYHPDAAVPSLNGCINDVQGIEHYLRNKVPADKKNIRVLINEQATVQAVTEVFKTALIGDQVAAGDLVFFFYSGHGSYGPTAPEFVALNEDTTATDETLVLYDSRLPGKFDLADKELALLLAAVNQEADIVVMLDSCHSGSATRGLADTVKQGLARYTAPDQDVTERSLSQYVSAGKLSYGNMQPLIIPHSKHILLAACGRTELAYEAAQPKGLFTSSLLKVLEQPGLPSYAQLFQHIYSIIKKQSNSQTPQLKAYSGFNSGNAFLTRQPAGADTGYFVSYRDQQWILNYGVLHGLNADPGLLQDVVVSVYPPNASTAPVGSASIVKAALNYSILKPAVDLDTALLYRAAIHNQLPALNVLVKGDVPLVDAFLALPANDPDGGSLLLHTNEQAYYDTVVTLNNDQITINDAASHALLHGIKGADQQCMTYIKDALRQICKWKTFAELRHMQSDIPEEMIRFNLQVQSAEGSWEDCETNDITLDISPDRATIPFRLRLESLSNTPYFIAVYALSDNFTIDKYTSDIDASVLTKDKVPAIECNRADGEEPYAFEMQSGRNEETDIYKLVVSQEAFSDYFIEEKRELLPEIVDKERSKASRAVRKPSNGSWMVKTIRVRLVKQLQQVDASHGFSGNGSISIASHPSFAAQVSITPMETASKGVNPLAVLAEVFNGDEFSFLDLAPVTRGTEQTSQQVVELTGITGAESLAEQPLQMTVTTALAENEQVVAVTVSDGLVLPLGWLEKADAGDNHVFNLYQAPATIDSRRGSKNPIRALWFCFLKVVGREGDVFKLRAVEYSNGKAGYSKAEVADVIKDKKGVLLAIHGIIGNTASIVANLAFLQSDAAYPYQSVIAFDYENLNTSIEEIAQHLKDKLVAAGVSPKHKIDILAHSMGGLVARYFVEKLGGYEMVDRLILVGTPNNGSSFGNLVTIRNWATGVLTLVCNYGQQFLGQFGPFLHAVNGLLSATKPITNTLGQMKKDSPFLKALNTKPGEAPGVTYMVVAGNTSHYDLADEAVGKKIMEKIKLAIGKLAYWSEDNDIAVSVESIRHIPAGATAMSNEIGCHHMNYFDYEKSLTLLKTVMKS